MLQVSPTTLNSIRVTMALIQQHETSLLALKNHMNSLIKEETGVDVTKWAWELDQETGVLTSQDVDPGSVVTKE